MLGPSQHLAPTVWGYGTELLIFKPRTKHSGHLCFSTLPVMAPSCLCLGISSPHADVMIPLYDYADLRAYPSSLMPVILAA